MNTEGTDVLMCRIVRDYADMLLHLAYSRLQSEADAEDCVQEVYLKLLRYQPAFRDAAQAMSYPAVTVPLVKAATLRADLDCAFRDEGVTGTVTGAAIRAGLVEFSIVIDGVEPGEETANERHSRTAAYRAAAAAALDGAVLNFAEGTSARVADLPSAYAGWVVANGELQPVEDGSFALRRITAQALDLSTIVSVTLDGETYPLA